MGKASKREEKEAAGDYEFKLPAFDERAFMRREISSAKASFYTLGAGFLAGVLSTVITVVAPPEQWQLGWIPIVAAMLSLRPLLQKLGFGEEATAWKALIGSYFMVFFTALAMWIAGVNVL